MLNRTKYNLQPTESEVCSRLLRQTLEVLSCTPLKTLETPPVAQFFAIAALRLNSHLLAYFETAEPALLALFDDRSTHGVERRRTRVDDLNPRCLTILGLTGIIEASMDSSCAGEIASGGIIVGLERLEQLRIDWRDSQYFSPLQSANTFDLRRYAVETVLSYNNKKGAGNSAPIPSNCIELLWSMLGCEWDDVSGIVDGMFTKLAGSNNNEMRDTVSVFLHFNSKSVIRYPQVYKILYEMLRRSRDEPLSYFKHKHCGYLREITDSFQSTATTHGNDSESMEGAVDAFLEQLVNNNLLGTLMLCAYASGERVITDNHWQGIRCARTTRFWGERVIALAQTSNGRQAASDHPDGSSIADQIRDFCHAPDEFIDDTEDHTGGEEGDDTEYMVFLKREKRKFAAGRRSHLPELKNVLLRELGDSFQLRVPSRSHSSILPDGSPVQSAVMEKPQLPARDVQSAIQLENSKASDQSHISIQVLEDSATRDSFTCGTNTYEGR